MAMSPHVKITKMQKIIFQKESKHATRKVLVNSSNGNVKITQLYKWDGAQEEIISLNHFDAKAIAVAILAAFPNETAYLIKELYENYLNETNEK
jgi:hypothetical protein